MLKTITKPQGHIETTGIVKTIPEHLPDVKDAIAFRLAVCQFDATPYRHYAESYVTKYAGLEFGEEDVKSVTKIIAELNKKAKEFDTARKEIKKKFNEPLATFEEEVKSIESIYNHTVVVLKSKLDVYEQKYRDKKTKDILSLIKETVTAAGLNEKYAVNIDVIEKYLNKTETLSKIKKDLAARCQQQLTYQENERLAKEAEAERLQRRLTMLDELNKNYAGRIEREVLYVHVAMKTDEEVYAMFENIAESYAKKMQFEKDVKIAHSITDLKDPANMVIPPKEDMHNFYKEYTTKDGIFVVEEAAFVPDATSTKVKHRYICEITTTATEDTILPWLRKMKEHGVITFVHKKLEE